MYFIEDTDMLAGQDREQF